MKHEYEYANENGEKVIIKQRMNDEHPDAIRVTGVDEAGMALGWRACDTAEPGAYVRIFSVGAVNTHPVTGKFPYVSSSLPRTISRDVAPTRDRLGRPVIMNREQEKAIRGATGYGKEDD